MSDHHHHQNHNQNNEVSEFDIQHMLILIGITIFTIIIRTLLLMMLLNNIIIPNMFTTSLKKINFITSLSIMIVSEILF